MRFLIQYGYEVVRHSWLVAAIAVKYILVTQLGLYYRDNRTIQGFEEEMRKSARPVVVAIFVSGLLTTLLGVELTPLLPVLGEIVALGYFAYLFWKY